LIDDLTGITPMPIVSVEIMPFVLRSGDKRDLAVCVRDEGGYEVLRVVVAFEVIRPN
jgi:hypothetical protein